MLKGTERKTCKTVNWWAVTLDLRGVEKKIESGDVTVYTRVTQKLEKIA